MAEAFPNWMQLTLPATLQALAPLQVQLLASAQQLGFAKKKQQDMKLACEEALDLLLQYGHDGGDAGSFFKVEITVDPLALVLRIHDEGLPFDTSILPEYRPETPDSAATDASGLSAYLMQQLTDRYLLTNLGTQGQHIELAWRRPAAVDQLPEADTAADGTPEASRIDTIRIRPLQAKDAIHLARVMYRAYGNTYVNPDFYLAEGILKYNADRRLTSWVAEADVAGERRIVGHAAYMKSRADDDFLEIGACVVAPEMRGQGLLNQMVGCLDAALASRPEQAAVVHAVTEHPFTQKAFARIGYKSTGLLLGLAPASLTFRAIDNLAKQRSSILYQCKLLKAMAPVPAFLPHDFARELLAIAENLGLPLDVQPKVGLALTGNSRLEVQRNIPMGFTLLPLHHAGEDFQEVLGRTLKAECRAGSQMLYLCLDLQDAFTPAAYDMARATGFIDAGLTPWFPWPATLCLQYVNNLELVEAAVHVEGDIAARLRERIFRQWREVEMISD